VALLGKKITSFESAASAKMKGEALGLLEKGLGCTVA
jgi:hypothetical protein